MRQAARSAPNLLLDAGDRVVEFLYGQLSQDGGAKDRSGKSDLYYTVFALEGLRAMRADPPGDSIMRYLRSFKDGAGLDLVHLACLARCWAGMPTGTLESDVAYGILQRIESYRSADGGYNPKCDAEGGTVYHCFLALGAYQDLGERLPNPPGLARCLDRLRTADGAYANEYGLRQGTTPATAAAVALMPQLGKPVPPAPADWLLARFHVQGGFLAAVNAPYPDLLSTATALHALAIADVSFAHLKDPCLDFLDTLWTGRAFRGHWADSVEDCEYTYYALLALGHLSS